MAISEFVLFSTFIQEDQAALLAKHGVFYAFSKAQFEAKAIEGETYSQFGCGGILPSGNVQFYLKECALLFNTKREEYLEKFGAERIILGELRNHESFYTNDISDAADALSELNIPREKVLEVFNNNYKAECNFF